MKDTPSRVPLRDKPIPFGLLILVLLVVEGILASAIVKGNLRSTEKLECIFGGLSFFVMMVTAVTTLLWFKPAHPGISKRVETITDVPDDMLEQVRSDFLSEGADVETLNQFDGKHTLRAVFLYRNVDRTET